MALKHLMASSGRDIFRCGGICLTGQKGEVKCVALSLSQPPQRHHYCRR